MEKAASDFFGLESQGVSARIVTENISKANILTWSNSVASLSEALHNFTRKAFQQQLPTASNLAKWNRTVDPSCALCQNNTPQTNKHVLSNCSSQIALDRYTARHNCILELIADWIFRCKSDDQQLHVDLPYSRFHPVGDVFDQTLRPDIVLVDALDIFILELTVCHESNLLKSKLFKTEKYRNINDHLQNNYINFTVHVFTVEVSVLGFLSNLTDFIRTSRLKMPRKDTINTIIFEAIRHSYNIYRLKNSRQTVQL